MRFDCRRNPAGVSQESYHDAWFRTQLPGFAVLLDGYKVDYCYLADTETGEVEHYAMDEKGELRFDKDSFAIPVVERGHVTIRLPQALPGESTWAGFDRKAKREVDVINPQPALVR